MIVWVGYVKSWRHMGSASLSCVSGCKCQGTAVDAMHEVGNTQSHLAKLYTTQAAECIIEVKVCVVGGTCLVRTHGVAWRSTHARTHARMHARPHACWRWCLHLARRSTSGRGPRNTSSRWEPRCVCVCVPGPGWRWSANTRLVLSAPVCAVAPHPPRSPR
jgi:hypothetical protein